MTEEREEWWEGPDEPEPEKPTVEELLVKMEEMRRAQAGVPRGLLVKQFAALAYVVVNAMFLYANIRNPVIGYVAVYMVPLTVVLLDYFLVVAELKKIARGERR